MIAVSDSSPLIALSRIGCFDLLVQLFDTVHIPTEVYDEVVIAGARLPGAHEIAQTLWIKVTAVAKHEETRAGMQELGLGLGEAGAIRLALELGIKIILMDERKARRQAEAAGLIAFGCIGILEMLHRRGALPDLRSAYRGLLEQEFRIDREIMERSLRDFKLPRL